MMMVVKPKVVACVLTLLLMPGLALSAEKSVIIGFKKKPSRSDRALVRAKGKVRRTFRLIPAMAASVPEQEIAKLRKNRRVAYVEENSIYAAAETSSEYDNSWGVRHISADVTHASGNRGTGVKVAILDTGIDYHHEDLDGNYRGGYDFVFDDDDPMDDNFQSHGTHVAGIIAAEDNGIGVIGVAPEADLYAVKVLDGAGFGTVEWIIAGIDWAVQNDIEIVNLSLNGPNRQSLQDACDAAYDAGVLLVAAGGNSLVGGEPVEYPAAYDSVIAVTATDSSNMLGYFSPLGDELELAAPGVDVLSTVAGGDYDLSSGTSQAAPHVTGAAALYLLSTTEDLSGDGQVNHEDVRLMLRLTATDLGAVGKDDTYGYGLLHAAGGSSGTDVTITVARTPGAPVCDEETVEIGGSPYAIVVTNYGLRKLAVDVFEGDDPRFDLSNTFHFSRRKPQEAVFFLDATDTHYHVIFTPYGNPFTAAEILVTTDLSAGAGVGDDPRRGNGRGKRRRGE